MVKVEEYIRQRYPLIADDYLQQEIKEKFGMDIKVSRIKNIARKMGLKKLPRWLRQAFGGISEPKRGSNGYNMKVVEEIMALILDYYRNVKKGAIRRGVTFYVRSKEIREYYKMKHGAFSHCIAYLRERGIVERRSKNRGSNVWKIDVWKLKKELELVSNESS